MAQDTTSIYPDLKQDFTPTSSGSTICSYSTQILGDGPIAVLIHGYPQSAFMWRYLIPKLAPNISIFVPELPGYGVSTLSSPGEHSKKAVGMAILEALASVFKIENSKSAPRKIILIGHDRGARISHRLTVSEAGAPHFQIISTILMDIVPTKVQWEAFSDPRAGVGYFHWPFLANVDQATKMIQAYGGDNWCRDLLIRVQGASSTGQKLFAADGAHDVYAANFRKKDAILGSCEDYRSGSAPEVREQAEDMKARRKLNVPTLVMFSAGYLGNRLDVAGIWKEWVGEGVKYKAVGVGNERGHYLPEEAPEDVEREVLQWVEQYTNETGN